MQEHQTERRPWFFNRENILQYPAYFKISLWFHPRCSGFCKCAEFKIHIYTIFHDLAVEMLCTQSIIITFYPSLKSITVLQRIFKGFSFMCFLVVAGFFNQIWPSDKNTLFHVTRQGICKSFRHTYFLGLITSTVLSLPSVTLTHFYSFHRWYRILLLEYSTLVNAGYHCPTLTWQIFYQY